MGSGMLILRAVLSSICCSSSQDDQDENWERNVGDRSNGNALGVLEIGPKEFWALTHAPALEEQKILLASQADGFVFMFTF
jgi:hypothetical protein